MFCFFWFGLDLWCGFFFVCLFLFGFVFLLVLEYFTLCRCDEIFFFPKREILISQRHVPHYIAVSSSGKIVFRILFS